MKHLPDQNMFIIRLYTLLHTYLEVSNLGYRRILITYYLINSLLSLKLNYHQN